MRFAELKIFYRDVLKKGCGIYIADSGTGRKYLTTHFLESKIVYHWCGIGEDYDF